MSATAKIHPVNGSNPDLDAIVSDLASLRRDLAALTDHLKIGAIIGAKAGPRETLPAISAMRQSASTAILPHKASAP